jgi:hypothetical protein
MINGAIPVLPDTRDFHLEIGDAAVELGDRQRIEILSGERRDRIIGLSREILVRIHGATR